MEHTDHAFEPEDRTVYDRDTELDAGIVEQVPRREVVGTVDHDVIAGQDVHDVLGRQPGVVRDDVDIGVEHCQRLLGRVDLAIADPVDVVQDLTLQVRRINIVHVDDADRADPGGSQVHRRRRTEPACAEHQHLGFEQFLLSFDTDFREQDVALVAVHLLGRERGWCLPGAAFVLPPTEATVHRFDNLVAEFLHRASGEGGPHTAGAVDDDRNGLVDDPALDL